LIFLNIFFLKKALKRKYIFSNLYFQLKQLIELLLKKNQLIFLIPKNYLLVSKIIYEWIVLIFSNFFIKESLLKKVELFSFFVFSLNFFFSNTIRYKYNLYYYLWYLQYFYFFFQNNVLRNDEKIYFNKNQIYNLNFDIYQKKIFLKNIITLFQKKGKVQLAQKLTTNLYFFFKIKYGFSGFYLIYLIQLLYKIAFFSQKKKKSGRYYYYPKNIPLHLFWKKLLLLLKQVLQKKVNSQKFIESYIGELEALIFQNKQSLVLQSVETMLETALKGRVNITKRYKLATQQKNQKKYFRRKKKNRTNIKIKSKKFLVWKIK
jgi:hypothetical protein